MFEAKVLADSISPEGIRLITTQATFPRFILAEFNTHRVFSRNSASSRAIPTEKLLERVENHPFVPDAFHKRIKGMGQGEALSELDQKHARRAWLYARDDAVAAAKYLMEKGVAKSIANRLLEPFMWHTVIFTTTSLSNFLALRCPDGNKVDYDFPAQPEIQKIAILIRDMVDNSQPIHLQMGDWHLPLVTELERNSPGADALYWARVSAGRCARVSYDTHENVEEPKISEERAQRLLSSGHWSPFEHQAYPLDGGYAPSLSGNFEGWVQHRKLYDHEADYGVIRWADQNSTKA